MSEPASKIALPRRVVWEPPLCHTVDHCDCWDESDPEFQCFTEGCSNQVVLEYSYYRGGEEKRFGDCDYFDSGLHFGILTCSCQSPVCDECLKDFANFRCRVCGQRADVDIIRKNRVMSEINWVRGEKNRGFWMMKLTDAQEFIDENLGVNYPFFLEWFLARGGVIDITEMNNAVMCEHVTKFKLFCLRMVFLKSTLSFIRRIPGAHVMSHYEPRFERFMRQTSGFVGSLQLIIYRKKDLKKYQLFGLMVKVIQKLSDSSVVVIERREFQRNLFFLFPRIYTRIN